MYKEYLIEIKNESNSVFLRVIAKDETQAKELASNHIDLYYDGFTYVGIEKVYSIPAIGVI